MYTNRVMFPINCRCRKYPRPGDSFVGDWKISFQYRDTSRNRTWPIHLSPDNRGGRTILSSGGCFFFTFLLYRHYNSTIIVQSTIILRHKITSLLCVLDTAGTRRVHSVRTGSTPIFFFVIFFLYDYYYRVSLLYFRTERSVLFMFVFIAMRRPWQRSGLQLD